MVTNKLNAFVTVGRVFESPCRHHIFQIPIPALVWRDFYRGVDKSAYRKYYAPFLRILKVCDAGISANP